MADRNAGFTLIEILVVITIIAGLMGLGIVLLGSARDTQDTVETSNTIQAIQGALTKLSSPQGYGIRPSTDPSKLTGPGHSNVGGKLSGLNRTNMGIESVYVALFQDGVKVPLEVEDEVFGNTDNDKMKENVTRSPSDDLREFLDSWGNPIAYFRGSDMRDWKKYSKYVMGDGREVEVKPWMRETTGDFINVNTWQLFSAGPDGEFNTEDDIKSWK